MMVDCPVGDEGTYDGIDWGGERVTQEVRQRMFPTIAQIFDLKTKLETNGETITKFSITGYSLGGLVARYVIGILYQRSFFSSVTPVNFNTFATPHVGIPGYETLFNKLSRTLGPKLLGRTGTQFYAVDKWGPRDRPLLTVMSDPGIICSVACQRISTHMYTQIKSFTRLSACFHK
jgi:hypothetical protein